jgi:methylene-fatty-acyl-phospholipid synthase
MLLSTNIVLSWVAISASSAFYTFIWLAPAVFTSVSRVLCGSSRSPVRTMALGAHALKVAQGGLIAAQLFQALPGSGSAASPAAQLVAALRSGEPRALALLAACAALLAFGQTLNARVYYLLGEGGVYYGNLLEPHAKRPWVTEWPYSSRWLRHPQYLGSSLSALACAGAGLMHPAVAACWIANYAYLALLESNLLFARAEKRGKA